MVGVKGQNVCGCQSWALLMMERIAVFKNPGCFCSVLPRDNLIIMAASKWGGVIISVVTIAVKGSPDMQAIKKIKSSHILIFNLRFQICRKGLALNPWVWLLAWGA